MSSAVQEKAEVQQLDSDCEREELREAAKSEAVRKEAESNYAQGAAVSLGSGLVGAAIAGPTGAFVGATVGAAAVGLAALMVSHALRSSSHEELHDSSKE